MSQPLFAACIVTVDNFFFRMRLREKSTVSFAAIGAGLYSTVTLNTET